MTRRPRTPDQAQAVHQIFGALSIGADDEELVVAAGAALLALAERGDDTLLAQVLAPRPGVTDGLQWCVRRYAAGRRDPVEAIDVSSPAAAVNLAAETGSGWDAADLEVRDSAGVSWRPAERRGAEFLAAPPTGAAITGDDAEAVASARAKWTEQLRRWSELGAPTSEPEPEPEPAVAVGAAVATPPAPPLPPRPRLATSEAREASSDANLAEMFDALGVRLEAQVAAAMRSGTTATHASHAAEELVSDERLLTAFAEMARRLDQVTEILERAAPDDELIQSLRALARPASAAEIANEVVSALPPAVTPAQLDAQFVGLPKPATEAHLRTYVLTAIENAAVETQQKIADRLEQAKARELAAIREEIAAAMAAAPRVPAQVDQAQLSAALGSLRDEVAKLLASAPQLPTAAEIVELIQSSAPGAVEIERLEAAVAALAERIEPGFVSINEQISVLARAMQMVVDRQEEDRQQIDANRDGLVAIARRLDAVLEWSRKVL